MKPGEGLQVELFAFEPMVVNRTEAGAQAQAVTSSVLATCQKKAVDVFQFLGNAFRGTIGKLFTQPAAVGAN